MKKLLDKKIITELVCIFVFSLTPILWFRTGTILVGHDNTYPLAPKTFLVNRLSTWTENFFGHDQSLILGTIPIHFLDALPSFFGIPLQTGQAIVYVFWFFLIGVSAYILAWILYPESSVFRFTAVLLYQFNYFILQGWWIGEKSKFSAYIALPLILSVIFLVTRKKIGILPAALATSLILFVFNAGGLYGIPLFGGAFVAVGILIVFKIFMYWHAKNYEAIARLMKFLALSAALSILANAYFFIPAYVRLREGAAPDVNSFGGVSGIISWAAEISANTSFLNLFRLQGIPEWYDNPQHPYAKLILEHPIFVSISFLFPLLVLASFFIARKTKDDRIVTYFFIVYLVGIFFAAGTHPPLGFLYQLFVEHISGFVIFRSPYYKFAPAVFLATTFLVAYFISSFSKRIRTLMFVLLITIVLGYHYPYFTGNFFAWRDQFSTRLTIPSYVYEFGNWLNREKTDDGRVLFLPPNSADFLYSVYNWGYLSFQALPTLLSGKPVVINNDQVNAKELAMLQSLYAAIERRDEGIIRKLTSILHISYLVLQKDATSDPHSTAPVDGSQFAYAVKDNNQFILVRSFGQWDVYSIRNMTTPKFFMANNLTSLQGDIQELDPYYHFIADTPFVENSNIQRQDVAGFVSDFIIPTCLTCPFKNHPVISFPDRNILPDDPWYQIVLLLENRQPVPSDPKAAIYHLLGISLKRISEIGEMISRKHVITVEMVDRYVQLLETVGQYFQKLPSLQEKIEAARDGRDYIRAQRNFLLSSNLHERVPAGGQTVLAGRIFEEINGLEKLFDIPALTLDETRSRMYQFSLSRADELNVTVRTAEFRPMVNEGDQLSVIIDGNIQRDLRMTREMIVQEWLSFGRFPLSAGYHTLTILFPEPRQNIQPLHPLETEFSVPGDTVCFGTITENLGSAKWNKLTLSYLNNISDNLFFYVWDQQWSAKTLKNALRLPTDVRTKKNEQIIEVSEMTKNVILALCAPNLTQELIDKQFQVKISEILSPVVFLYSTDVPHAVAPVSFQQTGSTNYRIFPPQRSGEPRVLVFSERFDDWWELKGVKAQHVRANGYANAWIFDSSPPGELSIRYKGEKYFFYGKIISAFTILSSFIYLLRRGIVYVRHHVY